MLSFLYPSFLWALGVLSVPIIIHLFNFRRTTRVYFSNNRFLRQVKEATTAKRRLKHYLILASRLLFLFFLVITFCQPIIPASEQMGNNRNIVVYLDNSQSMSAQMEDKTRGLDAGMAFVNNLANQFPPDTRYKLITNDFAPFSNTFKTRNELQELLTQVRLSPVSRSMQEILDRAQQNTTARSNEVFWISDFQKSTLGKIPASLDTNTRWHLVPVTLAELPNVYIDSAYLDNPFAAGGEKNILRVKVRNDGKRDVDQLNLKLTINATQAAATTVQVPQGGIAETSFDLATGLSGLNEARIAFNDFPVNFDNEFYLALNFTGKINVVEIKSTAGPTPVEKVFGNDRIFSYAGFPVNNFNYSALAQADLVIVNGLNTIDQSLIQALRTYLDGFGTVFVIPGPRPESAAIKTLLRLPALNLAENKEPMELDKPDFSNPYFENVFEEKSISMAMPKASKILDWGTDRSAILRFKNDQPFLSAFEQAGRLYVLACPLEAPYTDFFNHALFVPVMYRMAAGSRKNESRLYYTLRENLINLRVDSLGNEEQLRFVGKDELIPPQRKVADHIFIDIPKFSISQGFYKVVAGSDTVSLLAFNLDKDESRMDQFPGEEMKKMLGNGNNISIFQAASAGAFSNEIKERYLGTPLWEYALLIALMFLLVEVLLIRFLK